VGFLNGLFCEIDRRRTAATDGRLAAHPFLAPVRVHLLWRRRNSDCNA
jgi:hypothetical protein